MDNAWSNGVSAFRHASRKSAGMLSDLFSGQQWSARPHPGLVRLVRPLVRALDRLHDVRLEGAENVPHGPALLVGNHGLFGYESPFFFERILDACGRLPIGLADRWFFKVPGLRDLLVRLGGAYGSAANGLRALRSGDLVVCYPGGAREVLKEQDDKYRLHWEKSFGFVRLALAARVPILPFAAAGVDDTFDVVTRLRGSGDLLMGHGKYDLPIVWGEHGPLPKRVPLWFRIGAPIELPHDLTESDDKHGASDEVVERLHDDVRQKTQHMLDELVDEWRRERGATERAA